MVIRLALYGLVAWLAAACVWLTSLPKAYAPSYAPMGIAPYVVATLVLAAGAVWVTRRSTHLLTPFMIYMMLGAVTANLVAPATAQSYESTRSEFQRSPLSFGPTWWISGGVVGAVATVLVGFRSQPRA